MCVRENLTTELIDIKSYLLDELEADFIEKGFQKFRARQVYRWLFKGVESFDDMTDLSVSFREQLKNIFYINTLTVERLQISKLDGTRKYLWKLRDGNCVESVLMKYNHGNTICISSQVGCRMGCKFCASTIGGLVRNLNPSELIDQVIFTEKDSGEKISNIVLMGIGEPLDNFDNVVKFLKIVNSEHALNIGMRHISLSTCGKLDNLDKLLELNLQLTLSLSLHAPNDEIRSQLMPVNSRWGVEKIVTICKHYFLKTGRRISYEYAMIKGINDSEDNAYELARLLNQGIPQHVNLIPINNVSENDFEPSAAHDIEKFKRILEKHGITATVRRKLGSDIDASCGQLRRKNINERG